MMENALPMKTPEGAQLGLGVRSASLYVGCREGSDNNESKWLGAYNDQLAVDLSKLSISNRCCTIDDGTAPTQSGDELDDEDCDNDISSSDDESMDEETYEHWREVLLSRLSWDSLSPVIPPNLQFFKEVEFESEHMYDVKQGLPKSLHDFVPKHLIADITGGSVGSSSNSAAKVRKKPPASYDPSIGNLVITGAIQTPLDLRNNYDQHQVIVYSCGRTNSVLKIGVIEEKLLDKGRVQIHQVTSFELGSSIRGIKIPDYSAMLDRKSDLVGVITESAFHVIKIESISSHMGIKTSSCEALPFQELGDFPFADFSFNPWDLHQFAIVDSRGNFGVGRLPKSFKSGNKIRLNQDHTGSIFDPEELSNWKKIVWSSSFSRLLVMDRSKMVELDFEQDWQLEVIQSKIWSKLLDYQRMDDDFSILLTNREIIIINTKQGFDHVRREISWKHDLDPNDSSIRLCARKINSESGTLLFIGIFSKNRSFLYIHPFILSNNGQLIQSLGTSAILQIPHIKGGLQGIWLHDPTSMERGATKDFSNVSLNMFVNENDAEFIWHYLVSNDQTKLDDWGAYQNGEKANSLQSSSNILSSKPLQDTLNQIKLSIPSSQTYNAGDVAEHERLQQYGYRLSEAINELIRNWDTSFESLVAVQPLIKEMVEVGYDFSLKELNSMLVELFSHYEDQGYVFTGIESISSAMIYEKVGSLEVLYNKLLQCWDLATVNSEVLTHNVVKDLVYSSLRFYKPSLYKDEEDRLLQSLTRPYRKIISMWDEDGIDSGQAQEDLLSVDYSSILASSQSQIPTIKSSQSRSSRKQRRVAAGLATGRVSKPSSAVSPSQRDTDSNLSIPSSSQLISALPDTMSPAFTLMQPPRASMSQSQSSQRSRRKKKKVGGFG